MKTKGIYAKDKDKLTKHRWTSKKHLANTEKQRTTKQIIKYEWKSKDKLTKHIEKAETNE